METRKENQQNDVIDLKELFFVYVKKWWLLLIGALAGAAIAFSVSRFLITPEYESTAMLYVLSKTTSVTSMVDFQLGDALAGDFSVIAKSNPVIDQAVEQIREKTGKNYTRSQVLNMISVNNQETRILVIKAVSTDPEDASIVANCVADATKDQMANITKSDPPTTVEDAEPAKAPVSPNIVKNTEKGFLLGLVLILAILTQQTVMNDNIKTAEDVQNYLGLNTLVVVPDFGSKRKSRREKKRKD